MTKPRSASKGALLVSEKSVLYNESNNDVQQERDMANASLNTAPYPTAEPMRFSHFRSHLFQVADAALASGEPVPLERNGQRLWLVPERGGSRIERLPLLDIIVGNPDELPYIETSEWNESRNLG